MIMCIEAWLFMGLAFLVSVAVTIMIIIEKSR